MFSYHFNMHLFRAKTFSCRPSSRTQTFRYRSFKQNKRFCYRLSKQNKTTLRTMSSNFLESTDPSTGNVCFFRFGTMSFKLSQPAIPYNDSCLASKTKILTAGNRQFLAMVWEPAVPCHGNLWFPRWEPSVPTFRKRKFFAMVTYGSQVGRHEFQPLVTGSCLQW